jgi:sulfur-oxidizing protein SoxZ
MSSKPERRVSGGAAQAASSAAPTAAIRRFSCRYDGEVVFSAELHAAIAANPYIAFHTVAVASGLLSFTWEGDNGFSQTESRAITVT